MRWDSSTYVISNQPAGLNISKSISKFASNNLCNASGSWYMIQFPEADHQFQSRASPILLPIILLWRDLLMKSQMRHQSSGNPLALSFPRLQSQQHSSRHAWNVPVTVLRHLIVYCNCSVCVNDLSEISQSHKFPQSQFRPSGSSNADCAKQQYPFSRNHWQTFCWVGSGIDWFQTREQAQNITLHCCLQLNSDQTGNWVLVSKRVDTFIPKIPRLTVDSRSCSDSFSSRLRCSTVSVFLRLWAEHRVRFRLEFAFWILFWETARMHITLC